MRDWRRVRLFDDVQAGNSSNPSQRLVTRIERDGNENVTLIRKPAGNTVSMAYNERDLLIAQTVGANDGAVAGTTNLTYDANGNTTQVHDPDGTFDPSNTATEMSYDGFDRLTNTIDELGNETSRQYDADSNLIYTQNVGETGHDEGPATKLNKKCKRVLNESACQCVCETCQDEGLDGQDGPAGGGGGGGASPIDTPLRSLVSPSPEHAVRNVVIHTPGGQPVLEADAKGNLVAIARDELNRPVAMADSEGNTQGIEYSPTSQPTDTTIKGISPLYEQVFANRTYYDALDRPVAMIQLGAQTPSGGAQDKIDPSLRAIGNTTRIIYDSRNLTRIVTDANGTTSGSLATSLDFWGPGGASEYGTPSPNPAINNPGNRTIFEYDDIGRQLSTTRELTSNGVGGSSVVDTIVTSQSYDENSRIVSRTDPKGNATSYQYDSRDRVIRELFPDNTANHMVYDRMSNLIQKTDQRGVTSVYEYDQLERLTLERILNPPGVIADYQTTFRRYRYDSLHRMTQAEDNDSKAELFYDQLNLVREERVVVGQRSRTQWTQRLEGRTYVTRTGYDGDGVRTRTIYPNGEHYGLEVDRANRPTRIFRPSDNSTVASYEWIGGNLHKENFENGAVTEHCYDGASRLIRTQQSKSGTTLTGFAYGYDRVGNRRFEQTIDSAGTLSTGTTYVYDSIYRLISADETISAANLASVTPNTAGATGFTSGTYESYTYDKAGNRSQVNRSGTTETYTLSGSDLLRNQYSTIASLSQVHDNNGNSTSANIPGIGFQSLDFDDADKLTAISQGTTAVGYRYDALGRRIRKEIDDNGTLTTVDFARAGQQTVVEFANGPLAETKSYVLGLGLDRPVSMTVWTGSAAGTYTYGHNSLGSVTALSDSSGTLVESNSYKPYGNETIRDSGGSVVSESLVGNPYRFTGRRKDFEEGLGLYNYRNRYYRPEIGRFISSDPIGHWGDPGQLGLGQGYCGNNPVNFVDPMGAFPIDPAELGHGPFPAGINPDGSSTNRPADWYRKSDPLLWPLILELVPCVEAQDARYADQTCGWFIVIGEFIVGLTPAGVAVDAKDLGVEIDKGSWSGAAWAGVGFIPGIGDLIKGARKLGRGARAGREVAEGIVRHGDEAGALAKGFRESADDLTRDICGAGKKGKKGKKAKPSDSSGIVPTPIGPHKIPKAVKDPNAPIRDFVSGSFKSECDTALLEKSYLELLELRKTGNSAVKEKIKTIFKCLLQKKRLLGKNKGS